MRAADKSGSRLPILGTGAYTYEATHNWGTLPEHIHWGDTHGVVFDQHGLIYFTHQSAAKDPMDAIAVFDPQGNFIRSFGKEFHGGGHGLAIRKEGKEEFLYVCDIKNRKVAKVSLEGHIVWSLGVPQEAGVYEQGATYVPTNVAFAPDGGFYVGDGYGSSYIHQYDKDAKWVRTWGGAGSEPGKLLCPHGLWWDDRPGRTPAWWSPTGPTPGCNTSPPRASTFRSRPDCRIPATSAFAARTCWCRTCTRASRFSIATTGRSYT